MCGEAGEKIGGEGAEIKKAAERFVFPDAYGNPVPLSGVLLCGLPGDSVS